MKWRFEQDLDQEELLITLSKQAYDQEVAALVAYLETFGQLDKLAIKVDDRIILLAQADVILVEVVADRLVVEPTSQRFELKDRLYRFKERLNVADFVQISRQTIININHLKSLEASFSGNLLAHLSKGLKTSVSRRYVKNLERTLGI
ncbi:LytTR family DNA-binding domain-containing protein [Streptococcus cuniculipharyngis]|uniref:LytTR family transcriptional regulator n=1 Tax=Streptococcus cuniculipharyngis TaxID=1562651 RepID=A0A5C5SD99_9STRE|nr:LytTR family DNA-binding domain-containing protein [Streptococcus cuniculipharyngis]TWS97656.1 LytTR family transcriptional regulator [Streptococcus cuniculipharyngis]